MLYLLFHLQRSHQPQLLNDQQLQYVASLSNMQGFDMTLDPILVPRVVGTPNHARVGQYIMDQMSSLNWDVETDRFSGKTPLVSQSKAYLEFFLFMMDHFSFYRARRNSSISSQPWTLLRHVVWSSLAITIPNTIKTKELLLAQPIRRSLVQ